VDVGVVEGDESKRGVVPLLGRLGMDRWLIRETFFCSLRYLASLRYVIDARERLMDVEVAVDVGIYIDFGSENVG